MRAAHDGQRRQSLGAHDRTVGPRGSYSIPVQHFPIPYHGPTVGRARRHAGVWLLCALLLAGAGVVAHAPYGRASASTARPGAEPAAPMPVTSAGTAEAVKYYLVGYTGTGEREYLFQIAARTLGDGRRYMEIFDSNKGRVQPDGRRLEDPLILFPGWILLLPGDAEGPGVVVGTPPIFGSAEVGAQPTGSATSPADSSDGTLRVIAFVIVTMALGVSLRLLRRGRRISAPATAGAQASTRLPRRLPAASRHSPSTRPAVYASDAPTRTAGEHARVAAAMVGMRTEQVRSSPVEAAIGGTVWRSAHVEATQPSPAGPAGAPINLTVAAGPDRLDIRLIGARPEVGDGFATLGDPGQRRRGGAVVRLGDAGADALWVDLTASPDVIRVTGSGAGVRRQAEAMARQLAATRVTTVVVGDVPGVTGVATYTIASLGELVDGSIEDTPLVVFVAELAPADVSLVHDLITRRRPRVVPVAVGPGPRARWSVDVR